MNRCLYLTMCIFIITIFHAQSYGWKAITHMYLAEEAIKDALTDDSVVLYKSDGTTLGLFAVNKDITTAIRNYPAAFRAGAIGPDAYPDILTGQQLIHPISGAGSCYWLNYLWDCSSKSVLADRAFTAGFFAHGAGDLFGHTYINYFAGGPFTLDTNAIKHTIVEGFIEKSLPQFTTWDNHAFTESDVSIANGLDMFIYNNLVYAPPKSHLGNWLFMGKDSNTSIPKYFSKLRNSLAADIDNYYATLRLYDSQYDALIKEAGNCSILDFSCSKVYLYAAASYILAEKTAYRLLHGLIITYKEAWRDDIDSGLKAWPALSHEVNIALNCNKPLNVTRASDACTKYVTDHLISMAGVPDIVGITIDIISSILDAIMPQFIQDAIEQAKKDLLSFLLKSATGYSLADLTKMISDPESQFNLIGMPIELFKTQELQLSNEKTVIDYQKVPAMFNTVNLIKMSFLTKSEIVRLVKVLSGAECTFSKENILLGTWLGSFDESCQWQSTCDTFVLYKDTSTFYKVFKHQTGETSPHSMLAKCSILTNDTSDSANGMIPICNSSGYLPMSAKIYIPITLPSDGELSFSLTATKKLAFAAFKYIDSTTIASIKCDEPLSVPCRYRAGNYLMQVGKIALMKAPSDSMSSVYYNLSVYFKPSAVQGAEPDDSISIAKSITPNSVTFSTIGFTNESRVYDQYDYYSFMADSLTGAVIKYKGISGKCAVAVLDSSNKVIVTNDFSGEVTGCIVTPPLTNKRYFIRVKCYNSYTTAYGSYSIGLNLVKYPSLNSIAGSVPVSGNELTYGNMNLTDSSKWYTVTLSKKDKIGLALATENLLRVKICLYDQTGKTVVDTAQSNDTNQYRLESDSLSPGTYYIQIVRSSGANSYSFYVSGSDNVIPVIKKNNQFQRNRFAVVNRGSSFEWIFQSEHSIKGKLSLIDVKGRTVKIVWHDNFVKDKVYRGLIDKKAIAPGIYYLFLQSSGLQVPAVKITIVQH